MWVEKDVRSIKEANIMFMGNIGERKADLLILRLSDARELLNVEVSGPPYRSTKKHTVGDIRKLLVMAVCSLCRLLGNNLDCNIEDAKNVKTYSIQVAFVIMGLLGITIKVRVTERVVGHGVLSTSSKSDEPGLENSV